MRITTDLLSTPLASRCMATRCQFANSNEVGVFAKLTNAYCLVAQGGSENFYRYGSVVLRRVACASYSIVKRVSPYSVFEAELAEHIPVVKTSVAGTRLVGRVCVGEAHSSVCYVLLLCTALDCCSWYQAELYHGSMDEAEGVQATKTDS